MCTKFGLKLLLKLNELTVLGLVRFLASVSQLLRWLYVLRLQKKKQESHMFLVAYLITSAFKKKSIEHVTSM